MDVDEGEEPKPPAEVFRDAITTKTDALTTDGEALASLDNVSALYPRGRYDLSLFPAFMDMDGPNHQYKIRCAASPLLCAALAECLRPGTSGLNQCDQ